MSERVKELMDDINAGRAPNTGRFCAACYQPLAQERSECPYCGMETAKRAPVAAIPLAILEAHKKRRGREGTVVRTVAWTGLTLGVTLALLPFIFWDVTTFTVIAFFGLLVLFYLLSANLANSVGDAVGYAWGRSLFEKRWQEHLAAGDPA